MAAITDTMEFLAADLVTDTSRRDTAITLAREQYPDPTVWNSTTIYNQAIANLACHMLALTDPASAAAGGSAYSGGSLNSIKTGDLQIGIDTSGGVTGHVSLSDAALRRTTFGAEFIRIRNAQSARVPTVIRVNQ